MNLSCERIQAWLLGLGLVFMSFFPKGFELETSSSSSLFFYPDLGELIISLLALFLLFSGKLMFGEKKVWIPLALLSVLVILRSLLDGGDDLLSDVTFSLLAFAVYCIALRKGLWVFEPFIPFVLICTIGLVIFRFSSIFSNVVISPEGFSYTWLATFLGLGTILGYYALKFSRWRIIFISLGLIGTLLTWAPISLLLFIFLFLSSILEKRRLDSKSILLLLLIVVVVLVPLCADLFGDKSSRLSSLLHISNLGGEGRLPAYERATSQASIFGHNFDRYSYEVETGNTVVHQMPLVILDMIGVPAAILWSYLSIYTFKRTESYLGFTILAFCIFDYMLWTLFTYWWWALVGVIFYSSKEELSETKDYKEEDSYFRTSKDNMDPYCCLC